MDPASPPPGPSRDDSGTTTARVRRSAAAGSHHVHSAIEDTILHPGTVRINVQGAFIVDEEEPTTPQSDDYEHDPRDIRLPNHTAVVSHVAVDVSQHAERRTPQEESGMHMLIEANGA
jgi:type II pantothenate kinase